MGGVTTPCIMFLSEVTNLIKFKQFKKRVNVKHSNKFKGKPKFLNYNNSF